MDTRRLASGLFTALAVGMCIWVARLFLQDRLLAVMAVQYDRVALLGWLALILLSSLSAGSAVLRWTRLRPAGHLAAGLFGVGIGLAILSTLTLLLGSIGFIQDVRLVVVLLVMLAVGLTDLGTLFRMVPLALHKARGASLFRILLWSVLTLFLLMNLVRAFEPPWDYDSLEYHLGAAKAYSQAGRVYFIHDNAYANFPQNMEMLYLLAMQVTGSPDRGATLGHLINGAMGFLAALALMAMLRGVVRREVAEMAAAFLYTWAGVTLYSGMAYVELALIFYGILALWGLLWSWRRKLTRPHARGWLHLAAIAAGIAMGVKYTAALLVFVPLAAWIVVLGLSARCGAKETFRRAALFALIALLAFSPWLIRNTINTGNPVYPLLGSTFDSPTWSAQQDAKWTWAHSPRARSFSALVEQTFDVLTFNEHKASMLLVLFIPLLLLTRPRLWGVMTLLVLHALLLLALWFFFTQHNARFLDVGIPLLAALSAIGLGSVLDKRFAVGARALVVVLLLLEPSRWMNYIHVERALGPALGVTSREEFFRQGRADFQHGFAAMEMVNALPEGSRVLFLGEARGFYCRRDCIVPTVFDRHPLEEIVRAAQTPADIREGLKGLGVTHLYVDTSELTRLQTSYRYPFQGRDRWGMLDDFNWPLFAQFARQHLTLAWSLPAEGPERFPWQDWPLVLERHVARERVGQFLGLYEVR